jgi:ATP:corrinoid adenosyltransferase
LSEPSTDTGSAGRTGNENPGLIHTCFGHGAGKTSRAVGLAIRAAGSGLNVHFIQFMKSGDSGEVGVLKTIPGISYRCPGRHTFIMGGGPGTCTFNMPPRPTNGRWKQPGPEPTSWSATKS